MMKKIFRLVMVALLCLVFAGPASAAILNSKHDFSADSDETRFAVSGETRMCVFCHTPHNAVDNVPLWNRSAGTGTYNLYTSSGSLTSATKNSEITSVNISFKCLSCHDGTLGIGGGAVRFTSSEMDGDNTKITGNTQISDADSSLTDDHPIGFDFTRVRLNEDTKIKLITDVTGDGYKLTFYNAGTAKTNQMECATCHDVHGQSAPGTKFLRTSNTGSYLCLSCHNK